MQITYGIIDNNIDVTKICFDRLRKNDLITIPMGDHNRAIYFSDPIYGILKKIFITNEEKETTEYGDHLTIQIDLLNKNITTIDHDCISKKLTDLHSTLQIKHGNFNEEIPEIPKISTSLSLSSRSIAIKNLQKEFQITNYTKFKNFKKLTNITELIKKYYGSEKQFKINIKSIYKDYKYGISYIYPAYSYNKMYNNKSESE